ncbi:MAG: copper resistance protein CopC [Phenylobacterium sp.]|nr:MAG: copper resistance protein CopC [Phenylobacterium sp.]
MRKVLILAAALATFAAGEASAHARLLNATPAKGATAHAPKMLRLSFSEAIVPAKSRVTVDGPGRVATGPLTLDPKNKHVAILPFSAPLAPGAYKVNWGATTDDGHHTEGTYDFKVAN